MSYALLWGCVAAIIALAAGYPFIAFLRQRNLGKAISDEGPETHHVKQGTPTFGGVLIMSVAIVVGAAVALPKDGDMWLPLAVALVTALVGLWDDTGTLVDRKQREAHGRGGMALKLAVFAVVDSLFFAGPAHVASHDRVQRVRIDTQDPNGSRYTWAQTPYFMYQGLRDRVAAFETLTGYRRSAGSLGTGADARPVQVVYAEGNYFALFRVTPRLGRFIDPSDNAIPPGAPVIVVYCNADTLSSRIADWFAERRRHAKLSRQARSRRVRPSKDGSNLYYHRHPVSWWSSFEDVADVEILPWIFLDPLVQKAVVPDNKLGRGMLKLLYKIEDRYPGFFGRNAAYSMIVLRKKVH